MTISVSASVPVIDIGPLRQGGAGKADVAAAIGRACRDTGFFYISNHGVDAALQSRLEDLSSDFFRQDLTTKMEIAMAKGGPAWRGYFPVGDELTSGKPDLKEGVYFGAELDESHPGVRAGRPMHGRNLFPESMPAFRRVVLDYIHAMTQLGHVLMIGISESLGLPDDYFSAHYTKDPLVLFRIFNYPAPKSDTELQSTWGVGEHTDYGVLTILRQDDNGGLEVKARSGWLQAPPIPGTFVCNIGDMLDRLTGGLYRSTPHRVRNVSGRSRLSWPFFFDPGFEAVVKPLPIVNAKLVADDASERWDKANVHAFDGTYGDYLLQKVGKVFPDLQKKVLK